MTWVGRGCLGKGQSHIVHGSDYGGTVKVTPTSSRKAKIQDSKRFAAVSPIATGELVKPRKALLGRWLGLCRYR